MRQRLAGQANVEHFPATRVVACGPGRRLLLEDPQRGWQVGYRRLVLCTGARELLLPFPGWTLPGVTGAGGLQALAKGGLPLAGQRLVVAGSGPLLLASAASASQCGARLLRVAEQAPARTLAAFAVRLPRWPGKLWQAAGLFARSYRADSYVLAALGERLEAVRLREGGRVREIACDRLACGFGLVPNVQLGQALGYRLDGQALAVDEWQAGSLPDYAAGECTGFGGSELAPGGRRHRRPCRRRRARRGSPPVATTATLAGASPTPWRDTSPCVPNCVNWRRRIPWSAVAKTSLGRAGRACRLDRGQAAQPLRHGRLPGADMRQRRAIPVRLDASGAASAVQPGAPGDPGPLAGRRRLATLGAIQPAEAGQRQQQTTQQHGCQRLGEHPVRP